VSKPSDRGPFLGGKSSFAIAVMRLDFADEKPPGRDCEYKFEINYQIKPKIYYILKNKPVPGEARPITGVLSGTVTRSKDGSLACAVTNRRTGPREDASRVRFRDADAELARIEIVTPRDFGWSLEDKTFQYAINDNRGVFSAFLRVNAD